MNYKEIQEQEIVRWHIVLNNDTKCWKRMHAHCDGSRKICKWYPKESYNALFSLLHEIGHIETDERGMKRAEQESVATLWAIARLKELGLPIKRRVTRQYKDYIAMTYQRGVRRGLQKNIKSSLYM